MSDKRKVAFDVLAKLGSVERDQIKEEMDLVADLGIDSPKALQLLVELEDTLDIEISDEDAAKMTTVGDVLGYLDALDGAG
jgi:acyl carrier protein